MSMTTRIGGVTIAATLLLALPIVGSAYEVTVLEGRGAEFKAINDGKYDIAIQRIEARLKNRQHNRDILLTNLCTALVITRDLEKAHDVCNEAVERDGNFVGTAYNSRGVLHALMNDAVSAMADFEEAAKKTNYPPMSYGSRHRRVDLPDEEIKTFQLAGVNKQEATEHFDKMTAGPSGYTLEEEEEK